MQGEPLGLADSIKHQFKILFMKTIQLMRTQEIHTRDIIKLREENSTLRKDVDDLMQMVMEMREDVDDLGNEVADMSAEDEGEDENEDLPTEVDGEIRQ